MGFCKKIRVLIITIYLSTLSLFLCFHISFIPQTKNSDKNDLNYYKIFDNKNFIFINENFNILQISDLHIWSNLSYSNLKYQLINELILKTEPDLIVLTGDNVINNQSEIAMTNLCSFLNHYNIPWTFAFGNHDSETENNRQDLADIAKSYNKCLFQDGPEEIDGIGNYVLELKDEKNNLIKTLVFFDTHNVSALGGFDGVHDNQIKWYEDSIKALSKDKIVPSIIFMHIPFYEFKTGYENIGIATELLYGFNDSKIFYRFA